jgi:hypothetical protein
MREPRRIAFGDAPVGQAPPGFDFVTTRDGPAGRWVVQADGPRRVLAQLDGSTDDRRFAMALVRDVSLADLRVSVRGKPVAGEVDRAVGLAWRVQSANDYYVARANALEGNVRLYRLVNGNRIKFGGVEDVSLPLDGWQHLAVEQVGARIRVDLDGRELFQAEDHTFPRAGRVGLWIKSDSQTWFDDLTIEPR